MFFHPLAIPSPQPIAQDHGSIAAACSAPLHSDSLHSGTHRHATLVSPYVVSPSKPNAATPPAALIYLLHDMHGERRLMAPASRTCGRRSAATRDRPACGAPSPIRDRLFKREREREEASRPALRSAHAPAPCAGAKQATSRPIRRLAVRLSAALVAPKRPSAISPKRPPVIPTC